MARDELYDQIVSEFKRCGSVKKTASNVGTSLVRAQRVLITEGLWSSETSEAIRKLAEKGMTVPEIASEMYLSVKTVQAYFPYTKGFYSENRKSHDAKKSDAYRRRKHTAAAKQVHFSEYMEINEMKTNITPITSQYYLSGEKCNAVKLRLELIQDLAPDQMAILRQYGKVHEGIIREIIVPSEVSLHRLNYAIQRVFGWQNSHLHHFTVPAKVFAELTGGKYDGEKDERYSRQTGKYVDWIPLCGTYFRYPTEDWEDVYWDDDYDGSVSIKTWFRRKYNGPDIFLGNSEHFYVARLAAEELLERNPKIMSSESWRSMLATKERKIEEVSLREANISDLHLCLEGKLDTLLERLPLNEVLQLPGEKKTDPKMLVALKKERNALFEVCKRKYKEADTGVCYLPSDVSWVEDSRPVLPISDELIYRYDYGDGWGVRITCTDAYFLPDLAEGKKEASKEDGNLKSVLGAGKVLDQNQAEVGEEISEAASKAALLGTLTCVFADGLGVMDDVGGIDGYVDFLKTLHEGEREERESCRFWASDMGWSGRRTKPENML